jgi:hypothetical protein
MARRDHHLPTTECRPYLPLRARRTIAAGCGCSYMKASSSRRLPTDPACRTVARRRARRPIERQFRRPPTDRQGRQARRLRREARDEPSTWARTAPRRRYATAAVRPRTTLRRAHATPPACRAPPSRGPRRRTAAPRPHSRAAQRVARDEGRGHPPLEASSRRSLRARPRKARLSARPRPRAPPRLVERRRHLLILATSDGER